MLYFLWLTNEKEDFNYHPVMKLSPNSITTTFPVIRLHKCDRAYAAFVCSPPPFCKLLVVVEGGWEEVEHVRAQVSEN